MISSASRVQWFLPRETCVSLLFVFSRSTIFGKDASVSWLSLRSTESREWLSFSPPVRESMLSSSMPFIFKERDRRVELPRIIWLKAWIPSMVMCTESRHSVTNVRLLVKPAEISWRPISPNRLPLRSSSHNDVDAAWSATAISFEATCVKLFWRRSTLRDCDSERWGSIDARMREIAPWSPIRLHERFKVDNCGWVDITSAKAWAPISPISLLLKSRLWTVRLSFRLSAMIDTFASSSWFQLRSRWVMWQCDWKASKRISSWIWPRYVCRRQRFDHDWLTCNSSLIQCMSSTVNNCSAKLIVVSDLCRSNHSFTWWLPTIESLKHSSVIDTSYISIGDWRTISSAEISRRWMICRSESICSWLMTWNDVAGRRRISLSSAPMDFPVWHSIRNHVWLSVWSIWGDWSPRYKHELEEEDILRGKFLLVTLTWNLARVLFDQRDIDPSGQLVPLARQSSSPMEVSPEQREAVWNSNRMVSSRHDHLSVRRGLIPPALILPIPSCTNQSPLIRSKSVHSMDVGFFVVPVMRSIRCQARCAPVSPQLQSPEEGGRCPNHKN